MELYMIAIYSFLGLWALFSMYYTYRVWSKGIDSIIPYVFESIPNVFTTLGILGTFIGIYFGLRDFDVSNVSGSIPNLLEGLKTSFSSSILGIVLSLVLGKVSQIVLRSVEQKNPINVTSELVALERINQNLIDSRLDSNTELQLLNKSLVGDSDISIAGQLMMLRNQFSKLQSNYENQDKILQKLRTEQKEVGDKTNLMIASVVNSLNENNKLAMSKFDEFSELLAKNNTEALVEVMTRVTEEFNKQMSTLIEKLVQENFQELNASVNRMNQWQHDNKDMIGLLTDQFTKVSHDFKIASTSMSLITENTEKLTNADSHLSKLIHELQKVMIDDTKFVKITEKLSGTIDVLNTNTEAFDNTTNKLNDWVRNQMNFSGSVAKLLTRLEDIERIKDINDVFWNDTKDQMNEGVSIIKNSSKQLSEQVDVINAEFYQRLNGTFQNLDELMSSYVTKK